MRLRNRKEAGRLLAEKLTEYIGRRDVVVLSLPIGGVPVGSEIAHAIGASLEPLLVRRLPVPGNEELEMGAISTGGATVLDAEVISYLKISPAAVDMVIAREKVDLEKRWAAYCGPRRAQELSEKTAILTDDGFASVWLLHSAVQVLRQLGARQIIIAAPMMSRMVVDAVCPLVDRCVTLDTQTQFGDKASWYEDFIQPADSEIRELLARSVKSEPQI
ncbi:MAG: phosphoribosyltransferase [Blastocatellia bacterium AA13]|nr:MAG: phosphoribosyltransferase [Blastocatellia bacterium AA13]